MYMLLSMQMKKEAVYGKGAGDYKHCAAEVFFYHQELNMYAQN